MRIALPGDFDTFVIRGRERPAELLPYHLEPGLNLLRGFRQLGITDVHVLVVTPEVRSATVEEGPLGTVHRLPCPAGSGSASFFLWRRRLLLEELRRIQPDIVHGQGTEREYGFTAATSPYPNVLTIHGIMHRVHEVVPPPLLSLAHVPRWLETITLQRARHVICISRGAQQYLKDCRSPAQAHLVPNAVGPAFFAVTPPPGEKARDAMLLFVGTIYPLKGLLNLVEALPLIAKEINRPVRLRVIGGSGSDRRAAHYLKTVRERARQLSVTGQIDWLGVRRAEEVAGELGRSDLLVLPSFCENMPMCIAEAMAAGVPVVSTTAPFIPDLIEHGVNGWLVTAGRSDELASAIAKLLLDPRLAQQLAGAARANARAAYTAESVATRTLAVYEAVRNDWRRSSGA